MKRARLISDIQTFDQAKRVEETVKSGYVETTVENFTQWMAVEEDLAASYERLSKSLAGKEERELAERLHKQSTENITALAELLERVETLESQQSKRIDSVAKFARENP